ncbi:MAG: N-acetylmuramoyl-L-alanine amidase [Ascidiaceihabitans sp.]|nr:N-acetylmuramoyl-L-alanine amidase [Ascidiaceihabitans sp.]
MRYVFQILAVVIAFASSANAQNLGVVARVDAQASQIVDGWFGKTTIEIHLSQGVPFRVFHLDNPARLIVDFREADWTGVSDSDLLEAAGRVSAVRYGPFRAGWSRLVMDLSEPMLPHEVAMPVDAETGRAVLTIQLKKAKVNDFAAAAGAPEDAQREAKASAPIPHAGPDDRFVIVIDPGHGGVDPGAVREGMAEKDLMLTFARELADKLARSGEADVYLTRNEDVFVSLPARVGMAHRAKADLFLSLHADAIANGQAHGTTVYTLSDEASDAATAQLAAQHNRADIIAGVDLTGADDQVAEILIELARQETGPRNDALAVSLIEYIEASGAPLSKTRQRRAGFSVLKSADIPSVLVEVGFMSSSRDLANLRDPVWRANMVQAMRDAILTWRADDLATRPLVRQ